MSLNDEVIKRNGEQVQLGVIRGELAELITAISDHYERGCKDINAVITEIVDVDMQVSILKSMIMDKYPQFPKIYTEEYNKKIEKLRSVVKGERA